MSASNMSNTTTWWCRGGLTEMSYDVVHHQYCMGGCIRLHNAAGFQSQSFDSLPIRLSSSFFLLYFSLFSLFYISLLIYHVRFIYITQWSPLPTIPLEQVTFHSSPRIYIPKRKSAILWVVYTYYDPPFLNTRPTFPKHSSKNCLQCETGPALWWTLPIAEEIYHREMTWIFEVSKAPGSCHLRILLLTEVFMFSETPIWLDSPSSNRAGFHAVPR